MKNLILALMALTIFVSGKAAFAKSDFIESHIKNDGLNPANLELYESCLEGIENFAIFWESVKQQEVTRKELDAQAVECQCQVNRLHQVVNKKFSGDSKKSGDMIRDIKYLYQVLGSPKYLSASDVEQEIMNIEIRQNLNYGAASATEWVEAKRACDGATKESNDVIPAGGAVKADDYSISEPASNEVSSLGNVESQYSQDYTACMDKSEGVTANMLNCIAEETDRQDKKLNENYKIISSNLNSSRKTELRDAQRLWIKYRKANCNFYANPNGGTMHTLMSNECFLRMTAERAEELKSFEDVMY